jgi:hypothetical protein
MKIVMKATAKGVWREADAAFLPAGACQPSAGIRSVPQLAAAFVVEIH